MESSVLIPSSDDPLDSAYKKSIERRHSSAALLPLDANEKNNPNKTLTSYSFRERSPTAAVASQSTDNKKVIECNNSRRPPKLLGVRFCAAAAHADGDDEKADIADNKEAKEFFLSVPMTRVRRSSNSSSSVHCWKQEDVEMSVINSQHNTTRQQAAGSWTTRSAVSLKSPQRQVMHQQQVSQSPSTASQHQRSQSMRVGYGSAKSPAQKEDDRRRTGTAGSLLQVPSTAHRPRGTSLPSHRVLVDASMSAASAALYGPSGGHHQSSGGRHHEQHQQPSSSSDRGDDSGDYYLIRQFVSVQHGKGNKVVNRGDSIRRLATARNPSSSSTGSLASSHHHQQHQQHRASSASQLHLSLSANAAGGAEIAASPTAGPCGGSSTLLLDVLEPGASSQCWTPVQQQQQQAGAAAIVTPETMATSAAAAPAMLMVDPPLRCVMLGASGVGKTALTAQFMTSEYLNTYEASLDDDACDRCVSVLLDGEESQLVFIDHPHGEISVENCMSTYNPHAYVIVYSVVDVESVRTAEETLHFLWRHQQQQSSISSSSATLAPPAVVILVANKIDLVRSRVVTPQAGKSLATSFDCKYIETSSGMQHNVDELLVGILKQIRLKMLWHQQQQQQQQQVAEHQQMASSSSRSLFRKRSSGRRQRQQQQQTSPSPQHDQHHQAAELGSLASQDGATGTLIGSVVDCCGIISSSSSPSAGGAAAGALSLWSTTRSPSSGGQHRRSASLRVRKMLGKAVWTCADYYGGKSRSCEDLHVL